MAAGFHFVGMGFIAFATVTAVTLELSSGRGT